jgi:endonuclease I
MRVSIFSSALTGYLAGHLPCHPLYLTWTREHVIPKSIINSKQITEDPRNIIPMPQNLNQARGNRPYTSEWKDGYLAYSCTTCPHPGFCRASMVVSPKGAHPPDIFKGVIARSVLYSIGQYPKFAPIINDQVLDMETAIKWDSHFPMSKAEKTWLDSLE